MQTTKHPLPHFTLIHYVRGRSQAVMPRFRPSVPSIKGEGKEERAQQKKRIKLHAIPTTKGAIQKQHAPTCHRMCSDSHQLPDKDMASPSSSGLLLSTHLSRSGFTIVKCQLPPVCESQNTCPSSPLVWRITAGRLYSVTPTCAVLAHCQIPPCCPT